ncbi:MAG TPA: hypothetical protein ENJ65_01750 [Candidatus Tenderia electrophaga]|uniref:Phage capsid protein n=1 Tax=Candidatus Tenderia electrophaga TaxID=1748243 RepID=A0A832J2W8_9GAMM|nr:hypothetical protein [Candidatus Tenderia electrophaga]
MPTTAQRRVIDPILSNVVQGYKHPEHIGMALFPRVPVNVAGGKIIEFDKKAFQLYSTLRAPGTVTKRVQFGYEGKPFALENHALEAPVPREHQRDAIVVPGIDLATRAINGVMRVESLALENQQAGMARNAANYDANHQNTLAGTDQWSDYANSNPIKDVDDAKEAIRSSTGVYPNVMELSAKVFKVLKEHPSILDKIKYTQRGVVTAEILASVFDIAKVVIGKAIGFDDAGTTIDVWGKDVVLAYVPANPSGMEEPSYGYTYTMEGNPAVEQPYYEQQSKSWIYGTSYERAPVISGIASGFLIVNAVP